MADPNKPSIEDLMKTAQEMQKSMQKAHEELVRLETIGEAGAGAVKITINGEHDAIKTKIEPEAADDIEVLEDLIVAAINDANRKIKQVSQEKMMALSKDIGLPPGAIPPIGDDNK